MMTTWRAKCPALDCPEGCCTCGAPILVHTSGPDEVSQSIVTVTVCKDGHMGGRDYDLDALEMSVNEGLLAEAA